MIHINFVLIKTFSIVSSAPKVQLQFAPAYHATAAAAYGLTVSSNGWKLNDRYLNK